MKSHELAKKLLSLPDLDVYTENKYFSNPGWEFKTEKCNGEVVITPTGLFLDSEKFYIKGYSDRSPNDEPVIGSYLIYFTNGEIVKDMYDSNRINTATVKYLSTGESRIQEYGTYNMTIDDNCTVLRRPHERNIVLVTNNETYSAKPLHAHDDPTVEHRYVEDIELVRVLVSYDKDTWFPTYQNMTYWDAIEYGKSL